jgi:flagellar biosynthesis component FlhA
VQILLCILYVEPGLLAIVWFLVGKIFTYSLKKKKKKKKKSTKKKKKKNKKIKKKKIKKY